MNNKVRHVIARYVAFLSLLLLVSGCVPAPKGNILNEDYYDWFGYSSELFQLDDRKFQSVDSSLFDHVSFERLTEYRPITVYLKGSDINTIELHTSKVTGAAKYYFYEAPNDSCYCLLIPAEGTFTLFEPLRPLAYVLRDISAESQENGEPIQSH